MKHKQKECKNLISVNRKPVSGFNLSQTTKEIKPAILARAHTVCFCNLLSFELLQTEGDAKQGSVFDLLSR